MPTETNNKPTAGRAGARRREWAALLVFFALLAVYFWNHASFLQGMREFF